jgi:hypothetical protein
LWDVTDATALQQWLDEVRRDALRHRRATAAAGTHGGHHHIPSLVQAINVDVTHTVYEVQEEFAIGLGEVVRTRAAEKASAITAGRCAQRLLLRAWCDGRIPVHHPPKHLGSSDSAVAAACEQTCQVTERLSADCMCPVAHDRSPSIHGRTAGD